MDSQYHSDSLGSKTYGEVLWFHFRNGLAHGFAVCHGGFDGRQSTPFFVVKGGSLELNPYLLFDDLKQAIDVYLVELRSSVGVGPLYANFDKVFIDVFINGN